MKRNEVFDKKRALRVLQSLFLKKGKDFSFDFGKNLTVVIGQDSPLNSEILKLFLESFHLNDSAIVGNLRNVKSS